jgi:hypothetical protein
MGVGLVICRSTNRNPRRASQHPHWKDKQPFKAVLDNDMKTLAAAGKKGTFELVTASHAGMSTAEFEKSVTGWFKTAKHPRFKRPYTELAYQPMLELLQYLRANDFKTYIVSGGSVEFMRPMTQKVYGIPPEHVVGSTIKVKYDIKDGKPVLMRLPEIDFIDDKTGKPVGINSSSASARSQPLVMPTATARCSSGPGRAAACG